MSMKAVAAQNRCQGMWSNDGGDRSIERRDVSVLRSEVVESPLLSTMSTYNNIKPVIGDHTLATQRSPDILFKTPSIFRRFGH